MVDDTRARLESTFGALSDPTRLAVIRALLKRPRRAGELADIVSTSPPALSRHLRVLRRSGLVAEDGIDSDARVRVYRLNPTAFTPIRDLLTEIENLWTEQLSSFKAHAERTRGRHGSRQ